MNIIVEKIDNSWKPEWAKQLDCEYTAPESTTEGIDCWEEATRRHLDKNEKLIGVYCEKHSNFIIED